MSEQTAKTILTLRETLASRLESLDNQRVGFQR